MVIGCWLAQQYRSGWQALASLDRMWLAMDKARFLPRTPETDEQIRTVLAWPDTTLAIERGYRPMLGGGGESHAADEN
jgi:hypothetical protein